MPEETRIRILSADLANKIAAGEVVERPASVVRELVENSLDAGAGRIVVDIEGAGRRLIRVSDDGVGMSAADAPLAFARHATSKLLDETGLFNITTMGFRGEALPSIASVSRMRLKTAQSGASEGIEFDIISGQPSAAAPVATLGTTVEVRDLFYNTPARRKFLKRDSTELMHVVDVITRLALSHPEKSFELSVDAAPAVTAPKAANLRERVMQLYGSEFLEGLVEFSRSEGLMSATGLVSRASCLRESRMHQYVFVNQRPVRDASVAHAVSGVFQGIAPDARHPVFFLMLRLDPHEVDFNVHPAKREVRFADKEGIYRLVRRAVSDSVRTLPDAVPFEQPNSIAEPAARFAQSTADASEPFSLAGLDAMPQSQALMHGIAPGAHLYLGETFVAYAEAGGGITLLDHHAAHERVLYEQLLAGGEHIGTRLLIPRQVRLSKKEHIAALEHAEALRGVGIEIEDFGPETVLVRSLPPGMESADIASVLSDAIAALMEGSKPGRSARESAAARMACHASVRGARVLGREELAALIEALDRCIDPAHCPHGRPTRVRLSLDDLKRMFGRK